MARYSDEFPADYTVPPFFLNTAMFTDGSWHNDACPSFYHTKLPVMVWVDHEVKAEREIGLARFAVCGVDQGPTLLATDDLQDVVKFFEAVDGVVLPDAWTATSDTPHFEVWYAKQFDAQRAIGMPTSEIDPDRLDDTHVLVARLNPMYRESVFAKMQGEVWSPNGEAREFIKAIGTDHTSMSVGDVVVEYGEKDSAWQYKKTTYVVEADGWQRL